MIAILFRFDRSSKERQLRWSSGYDARLTRERSPVQSRDEVFYYLFRACNYSELHVVRLPLRDAQ